MEYEKYDEKLWQPEILKKKERSMKTIQKYSLLVEMAYLFKNCSLPDEHPINIKLKHCSSEEDYLNLKFTSEEAAWIICLSLSLEYFTPLMVSMINDNDLNTTVVKDFVDSKSYDVICKVDWDNGFIYEKNEDGVFERVGLVQPISRYFSSDENTIMDIALRLDELILEEWEKQKNK